MVSVVQMFEKGSHCSYCGRSFGLSQSWPRTCGWCSQVTYQNPQPVSVVLLPVDGGLLVVRRGIEPEIGKLALPGGYVNLGETWQEAGARELFEETGVVIKARGIREFRVISSDAGKLVVFGLAEEMPAARLPRFVPNEETRECLVAHTPKRLAFASHTEVMREFFRTARSRRKARQKR